MTFESNSLLLVDFTARVKDGDVFDTTYEDEAKKHSIHKPEYTYKPRLISIGSTSFPVLRGFDEALAKSEVGQKLTIEVESAKGFGVRDSGKVRMIPLRKLGEEAEKVSIGDTVQVGDKTGIIRYIGSGRVQIDYNHKFAGKTIIYDAHVQQSLSTDKEKINGIIDEHFDKHSEFSLTDASVTVKIDPQLFRSDILQTVKHLVKTDIFKFSPSINSITFTETHLNKASVPKNNDAGSKSKTDTPTNDDTNNPAKVDSKSKKTD